MNELIQKARKEKLWLHYSYQDLWFTPNELEKLQAEGRFRWGSINFSLRNPQEEVEWLKSKVAEAEKNLENFIERIKACHKNETAPKTAPNGKGSSE